MIELWHGEFVFEITFSKYCSFDSHGDVINQKWCQKRSKLIFHVTMVIERWKSIVKGYSRWSISFWNHYLKILKFWLNMVMSSTQNWFGKGPKLVSLVLMVVERWGTLRWRILLWNVFSKSWNSSSMLWRHDLKIISKRLRSVNHVQLVVRLKSGTRITLVQKFFFLTIANLRHAESRVWTCAEPEFRLSWIKFCSSNKHYTTAPQLTWSGQNLYLRCVFQLLEIEEDFNHSFSWLPYRRLTFKDTCFYRTPLEAHYKHSSK